MLKKDLITYILSIPFIILFAFIMVFFDLLQRVLFISRIRAILSFLSYAVSYSVLLSLKITGLKINYPKLDTSLSGPLLIVSNHQSLMDIAIINCLFRKYRPHFIAKKELTKFVPFVAFNLRHEGHVIIDRSRGADAIDEIVRQGKKIEQDKESLVLFPEGTRAREGVPKKFKSGGFLALTKAMSSATIVPIVINSAWKISYFKLLPVPRNIKIDIKLGESIKISDISGNHIEVFIKIEEWIKSNINNE